jgi:NAD(P)-dependent dehydrogenase (short-subunit alcohol dehydrogenase family)
MPKRRVPRRWKQSAMPHLGGKIAIVTGATSGIGYQAALALAHQGATTIVAARNFPKARQVINRIYRAVPNAIIAAQTLDLGSLDSIAEFAEVISARHRAIHILINNGAIMGLPTRTETEDGFEQQVGVNYLGHFALTARLLPNLITGHGRIVNVASLAHRRARLELDDFHSMRAYRPLRAYGRSKLAMLSFAMELHRRTRYYELPVQSFAAHPGWARTSIIPTGMGTGLRQRMIASGFNMLAQPARDGAAPVLFAATAPQAEPGTYYGPAYWGETQGPPAIARIYPQANDLDSASQLWTLSEQWTGLSFGLDPAPAHQAVSS